MSFRYYRTVIAVVGYVKGVLCFEKFLLIRNWMDGWIDKNKIRKCLCFVWKMEAHGV